MNRARWRVPAAALALLAGAGVLPARAAEPLPGALTFVAGGPRWDWVVLDRPTTFSLGDWQSYVIAESRGSYVAVSLEDATGKHRFVAVFVTRMSAHSGYASGFSYVGGETLPRGRYKLGVYTDAATTLEIPLKGDKRRRTLAPRRRLAGTESLYKVVDDATGSSPGMLRKTVTVTPRTFEFVAAYTTSVEGVAPAAAAGVDTMRVCVRSPIPGAECAGADLATARANFMLGDSSSLARLYMPGERPAGEQVAEVDVVGTTIAGDVASPLRRDAFGVGYGCVLKATLP